MKSSYTCQGMQRASVRAPQLSAITLAMAAAQLLPQAASAAEYLVSDQASFTAAMNAANSDPDATATIKLTTNITLSGALPGAPTKPITIDTQGFTLNKGSVFGNFVSATDGPLTFNGTYTADAASTAITAISIGIAGEATINGSVTGGNMTGATGGGGTGVAAALGVKLITNNGTIKGGTSAAGFDASGTTAASGVSLSTGGALLNNASGVITGGNGYGGRAGSGVSTANTVNGSIVNHGVIRGGTDLTGGTGGGRAIRIAAGSATIENTGLLEGGKGASAIYVQANARLTIINSGAIHAGADYANAIEFSQNPASTSVLELHDGSDIVGNVLASASVNDVFRLGGDTDSEFDVASIGSTAQYRNFDIFQKTGNSTWSLIGDSTVAAPWNVQQGTLQLGNGGTSGTLASDVVVDSGATFAFNRSDTYTFNRQITGAGGVAQNGTGTTILSDAYTYTGPTTVNLGTLAIDGSITSPVAVNAAGTLSGIGTVIGDVTNSGTITPGGGSGVLTIDGNYIGNGGVVAVNTVLGDDSSATGRLVITGDTSGTGILKVTNVGGLGAATAEGIQLIDVQGASNGVFSLAGSYTYQGQPAIVAGAYAYRLYQGSTRAASDGGWYLRSSLDNPVVTPPVTNPPTTPPVTPPVTLPSGPLLAPTVPLYESYASVLQRVNELGTLQQRVGNRYWQPDAELQSEAKDGRPAIGRGAWVRAEGSDSQIDPSSSTSNADYDVHLWTFEAGFDAPVYESDAGTLVVGPTVHYGTANSSVSSMYGDGSIDVTGYGFGGAATWYGNDGTYVDGQATLSWYDSDLRSSQLGKKLEDGNRGNGAAASVEVGHRVALNDIWSITPQAQLSWSQVRFDSFTDEYGAKVSDDNGDSIVSRLGVSLDRETQWTASNGQTSRAHVYGITNLYYDFANGTSADVADLHVKSEEQALWGGLGVGASLNWDDDRSMLFGELLGRTSLQDFGDSHSVGAKVGVRVMW